MSSLTRKLMGTSGAGGGGPGEAIFSVPATYEFIVPSSVFELSIVAVGGGGAGDDGKVGDGGGNGGNGGGLVFANAIPVTPGQIITCTVGAGGAEGLRQYTTQAPSGQSTVVSFDGVTITAFGGAGGLTYGWVQPTPTSGSATGISARASSGGMGGTAYNGGGGGGGAAGLNENGSIGSNGRTGSGANLTIPVNRAFAGGGGGAGYANSTSTYGGNGGVGQNDITGGGGGGAALFTDPTIVVTGSNGGNGNGSEAYPSQGGAGGFPGGGGGGSFDESRGLTAAGGHGAVRIIWGDGRAFPLSTNDPIGSADYTFSDYVILNGVEQ